MRVGIFLGDSIPESGGGFTIEYELCQALKRVAVKGRHDFVVFSRRQDIDLVSEKVKFIRLKDPLPESEFIKVYKRGINVIKKIICPDRPIKRKDYYERYLHDYGIEVMWYLGPYYLTMEIPYIVTYYDLAHRLLPYFPEVSTCGEWDKRERRYKVLFARASVIIAGTEEGKSQIEYFYRIPSERIKVLPLVAPHIFLNAEPETTRGILDRYHMPVNYLFYPAQFWPHKNHANLLLALRLLKDEWKVSFPLVLAGSDKGNLPFIKKLVNELRLSDQIYFLGFIPREDLIKLYQQAFALVFPSFFGPDNLPPLEAFALGCPVIASDVRGTKEQLGDAALFIDPKKPREIALAIKSLHDDLGLRQGLIQRGFKRARKWTAEDYIQGIFSILDEFEAIRRCWEG
jgi:glycosyltransferase involved in cell wall biosynthesis